MRRCRMRSPAATPKTEIAPARSKVAGWMPPVSARGARSAQAIPGGTPSPFLVSACKSMKRSLSSPKSWAAEMSFRVVVADPVPSLWTVMVLRGIVTGAVLPALSSAQVPPAWMWFMCLMPASGRLRISSVTSTPPLTSSRVAVPLTPESRLWVRFTFTVWSSWASAFADRANARARAPNIVIARAAALSRLARYIILLRYHPPAATRSSGMPHSQVLAPLEPSAAVGRSPTQQTITASPLPKTDLLRRSGRLVVFAKHIVRPPQVSGGSIYVVVVRFEIRLGGGGGVGRQAVSQLVGIAEFADGENEYVVLVLILRGRSQILGSANIASEGNEVGLHFLDVVSGESVVAQQLVVAPEGGLHRAVLYASDLIQVRSSARRIGTFVLGILCIGSSLLRLTALIGVPPLGIRFSDLLGLCSLRRIPIRTQGEGGHYPHTRRHGQQRGRRSRYVYCYLESDRECS